MSVRIEELKSCLSTHQAWQISQLIPVTTRFPRRDVQSWSKGVANVAKTCAKVTPEQHRKTIHKTSGHSLMAFFNTKLWLFLLSLLGQYPKCCRCQTWICRNRQSAVDKQLPKTTFAGLLEDPWNLSWTVYAFCGYSRFSQISCHSCASWSLLWLPSTENLDFIPHGKAQRSQ